MKNLVLIVHANAQHELADQLRGLDQVHGFTFSPAEGHDVQTENDPMLSARDKVVGYVPRVRADVLLKEADLDSVLTVLRSAESGVAGQGVYWVLPVEGSGRL